jgi:hypothetical protein
MRFRDVVSAGILSVLWIVGTARQAAAQEWPPITDEEKALKDCPQQPGAPAVILYREESTSHERWTTTCCFRLKILTPAGRERANIEIPVVKGWTKITDLKARVVRPDGASVPFKGQVFEKTVLRTGRIKVTVKTFALPDVDVGSIIDYRYKVVPDNDKSSSSQELEALEALLGNAWKPREGGMATDEGILFFPVDTWEIQKDLFTRKAKFSYEPSLSLGTALADLSHKAMMLTMVTRRLPSAQPSRENMRFELKLENIPAFEPEEFMPPESSQRMEVRLFYVVGTVATPDEYWREESRNWQKSVEKFMRKAGTATAEAKKTVDGLDDPAAKIRALYGRAQQIRNLSYDRSMTSRKRKELGIEDNHSVADVLRNSYGLRSDVTRTFAALAVAAGFPARVVRVATRDDKLFDLSLCGLYSQFDAELAVVRVGGIDRFYDPATPYCPPGLVRWNCSSTTLLDPADNPPSFVKTPAGTPEQALTRRQIVLRLDAEGNLAGTAKVRFGGQEGLGRRLEHLNDDDVEVKKDLEAELGDILPAGAKVTLQKVENLRNSADEVLADFDISLPGLANSAGDRTLLPVSPLLGLKQHPFRHAQRKYPVSFGYPYQVSDDIVISLPAGMKVDTVPAPRSVNGDGFDYSLACTVENGTTLHVQRDFRLKKCDFMVSEYGAVRAFFDRVRAADEEQVVFSAPKK